MTNRDFSQLIGNTPLIRLNRLSDLTGCEILGKAEFMNPGGSVKDRAAKAIIEAAEKSGDLKPGGTIVEGTAGNTGISLTLVGRSKGYRSVIVMPETQSQEKKTRFAFAGQIYALSRLFPIATRIIMSAIPSGWQKSCGKQKKAGLSGPINLIIPRTSTGITPAQGPSFGNRQMGK